MESDYSDYFGYRGMLDGPGPAYSLPRSVREQLPVNRQARILDIGCGLGQMLESIKQAGYLSVEGIDVSDESIEACLRKGLKVRKLDVLTDWESIVRDGPFEFVIMSHVLEHLPKNQIIATLTQIYKNVLTRNGKLYIAVPNAQSNTGAYWAYEDFTHSTLFTAGSLLYVLRSAGLSQIEFLNQDGTANSRYAVRLLKKMFVGIYDIRVRFWNKMTSSSFHLQSPRIYTFDLQAIARRPDQ